MKEQTPITAEVIEILERDYGWKNLDQQRTQDLFSHILHDTISVCNDLIKAKVLEALEPIRKEIKELKKINELMKSDVKLAKSLLEELKQK